MMANNFLGGTAFVDSNNNGQFDTNEAYLPNATIELRSSDGSVLIATDTTDNKGAYFFGGLTPGDYRIVNLSASGFVGTSSQALSQLSPVTASTANSINVTLLDVYQPGNPSDRETSKQVSILVHFSLLVYTEA